MLQGMSRRRSQRGNGSRASGTPAGSRLLTPAAPPGACLLTPPRQSAGQQPLTSDCIDPFCSDQAGHCLLHLRVCSDFVCWNDRLKYHQMQDRGCSPCQIMLVVVWGISQCILTPRVFNDRLKYHQMQDRACSPCQIMLVVVWCISQCGLTPCGFNDRLKYHQMQDRGCSPFQIMLIVAWCISQGALTPCVSMTG